MTKRKLRAKKDGREKADDTQVISPDVGEEGDNNDDVFAEYDAANINAKPFLYSVNVNLSAKTAGLVYKFKIEALNSVGSVTSNTIAFILALNNRHETSS